MPAGRRSAFMPLSSEAHEVRYMARRCPLWSPGTEDEVRLMFVGERALERRASQRAGISL